MPFDGFPPGLLSDLAALKVALAGVRTGWRTGALGIEGKHCALGWLLHAADGNAKIATRLAVDYVWPALPESARKGKDTRIEAIYRYNDHWGHANTIKVFDRAVELAEAKAGGV
jgi:hypothetical protein